MEEVNERRPDADQARTARHVRELLREHPQLEPLRRANVPILVTRSPTGIRAHALLVGGERLIEARVDEERWWLPLRSGRARVLSEQLARDLRALWDTRGS
jgi:hypothetical protein